MLVVDVGGSHVKLLASGQDERRRFESGPHMTARQMVDGVLEHASDWDWDVVTLGVPAQVRRGRIVADPVNLGEGWVGFDFEQAFGRPTKVINDAAMQAIGSYEGSKMLYLGLGTGLGSALVDHGVVEPMELGHLPFRKATFEEYVGSRGMRQLGRKKWEEAVHETVARLTAALAPEYVVLGGGNTKKLEQLPAGARVGGNENAFKGGFRLWQEPERIDAAPLLAFDHAPDAA